MKIAITGANGHLGNRLLQTLSAQYEVMAIVRSANAKSELQLKNLQTTISVVDYTDPDSLKDALVGVDSVVHLVGIIKSFSDTGYENAHENACKALIEALKAEPKTNDHQRKSKKIIYLSIVGSHPDSRNACLASKGRAEEILLSNSSDISCTILQVPMVLGEGDFASYALRKNARSRFALTFRSGSLEQPIYAGDVIQTILKVLELEDAPKRIALAGPESISRKGLVKRAAVILGTFPAIISLPIALGMGLAFLMEFLPRPPVTRSMLGVLDHDDNLQVEETCKELGIELTPLDDMLRKIL